MAGLVISAAESTVKRRGRLSGFDPLKVACLVVLQAFTSGCGEDDPVSLVLEQAKDNQVFVKGGEFVLGDIGKPDGSRAGSSVGVFDVPIEGWSFAA